MSVIWWLGGHSFGYGNRKARRRPFETKDATSAAIHPCTYTAMRCVGLFVLVPPWVRTSALPGVAPG